MNLPPVCFRQSSGCAESSIDEQSGWIEADLVFVAASTKPKQVVEPLIEDTEHRDLGTVACTAGKLPCGQGLGKTFFSRSATCGHSDYRAHVEVFIDAAYLPWDGMYQTFGFLIDHCDEATPNPQDISQVLCLRSIFDPTDLVPDAFDRIEIASFFVRANVHIRVQISEP